MNDDPLGFVETPDALADWLAAEVLLTPSDSDDRILYPGAGHGQIAAAVHRHCSVRGRPCPDAVAVERDPGRCSVLRERFVGPDAPENHGVPTLSEASAERHRAVRARVERAAVHASFEVREGDFLADPPGGPFDYIVANPPYTAYQHIPEDDREQYAAEFETATGSYPLYAPFVEQMLDLLAPNGVLVFLAPIKWLSTDVTQPLRQRLRHASPATPELVPEPAFPDHAVTTTVNVVGRAGADWTGPTRPPSQTRLGLTHATGGFLARLLYGLGVADDEFEEAVAAYQDRFETHRTRVNWQDRTDREVLDSPPDASEASAEESTQQSGLERWSA